MSLHEVDMLSLKLIGTYIVVIRYYNIFINYMNKYLILIINFIFFNGFISFLGFSFPIFMDKVLLQGECFIFICFFTTTRSCTIFT